MKSFLVYISLTAMLIFYNTISLACSCKETEQKLLFNDADAVFLAEVTDTKLKKVKLSKHRDELDDIIEAKFTVIEVLKKSTYEVDIVRDLSFGVGNCSIGLISGMEYIFFVKKGEDLLTNYIGMCTGSRPVNMHAKDFEAELEKIRDIGKDELKFKISLRFIKF
ncbi:MAG: hypothetical protein AB8D52_04765 [Gammaproteobacteria bacterium]